jgi:hypothetical protein
VIPHWQLVFPGDRTTEGAYDCTTADNSSVFSWYPLKPENFGMDLPFLQVFMAAGMGIEHSSFRKKN